MNLKYLFSVVLVISGVANAQRDTLVSTQLDLANQADTLVETIDTTISKVATGNSKQVDEMIDFAKTFLGTPYHYAGTSPSGFDCSGFIYYVMGNFGMNVTRTSYGLAELGKTVKLADLRPGDLMFFKGRNVNSTSVGHVSMVVEVTETEIKMIHASTSRGVVIDNFKTSKYYIPRFIKAKRLDYGVKETE